MSDDLSQLNKNLVNYHSLRENNASSFYCLSVYHCYKPQKLHQVPFSQPTMLMVVNGKKQVKMNDKSLTIEKGDLLLLPPDTTMWIGNYPDNQEKKWFFATSHG